jgi:DNA-binding CsgD family transcriptional regulator
MADSGLHGRSPIEGVDRDSSGRLERYPVRSARDAENLLLVQGHTNSELAHRLHVAPKTVDHHVSSILAKLEVRSRTEAVAAAFGLGIIARGAEGPQCLPAAPDS